MTVGAVLYLGMLHMRFLLMRHSRPAINEKQLFLGKSVSAQSPDKSRARRDPVIVDT